MLARLALYHLSDSTNTFLCWVFSRQGLVNYLQGWSQSVILLISTSQVARITRCEPLVPGQISSMTISCKANQWQQIPSVFICLYQNIFHSILKDNFAEYRILG
jgi:hypothetical protein